MSVTFRAKLATTLCASLLALAPATALAQGSLLSGYSGPGGGEQVILGAQLLGGGGGGGGGGGSGGGGSSGATPSLRAATPTVLTPTPGTTAGAAAGENGSATSTAPATRAERSGTSKGAGRRVLEPIPAGINPTTTPGAPQRIAYPAADGAGALPFDAGDLGLLLAAAATLVLVAVATRRLGRWQAGGPDPA